MNTRELLAATLFSSLVGSMHCVGMCTPFAILAMGHSTGLHRSRTLRISSYHLGRLATYWTMGIGVALLNASIHVFAGGNWALQWVGWSVGVAMILIGAHRLLATFSWRAPVKHSPLSQAWSAGIVRLRRSYGGGPGWLSAFLWGLTSTLLPCGWLYLFVLAAAAAPNAMMSIAMMTAFWFGTLPLLSMAAWGWSSISTRWQVLAQPFAAGCIISFGVYILVERSLVDLRPLIDGSSALNGNSSNVSLGLVRGATEIELPCCRGDDAKNP
jgi:uncharacterized protein